MSSRLCYISDSNLLTISDNTNSVHNLLSFCNQKLLADNLSPQALLSGIILRNVIVIVDQDMYGYNF